MGEVFHGHSGDIGDLIYGLPAIRATGGGKLYLFHTPNKTTHGMNQARVDLIRPLLMRQPYIDDVQFYEGRDRDTNLNGFRDHFAPDRNLADMHLATMGLCASERHQAWLTIDDPIQTKPVVIHRSARYQNDRFPWQRIVNFYADRIVMIGLPDEHKNFCDRFGKVPFQETKDLLDVARVIKGSELFVGNQSAPAAIAEGLKHPMILEVCRNANNCSFERIGRINGWGPSIELPAVSGLNRQDRLKNELVRLLRGKTVAVVGNAPTVLDHEDGQRIDSADIVIRFNRFDVSPKFAKHVGTRTDVVATSLWARAMNPLESYENVKIIFAVPPLPVPDTDWAGSAMPNQILSDPISLRPKIYTLPVKDRWTIRRDMGTNCTTGGILIDWMIKNALPAKVDICGVSFKRLQGSGHYHSLYSDPFAFAWHDQVKEGKYLMDRIPDNYCFL